MTPQERLALALQYQKQRELGSALPSTPAENAARPVQAPTRTWLDDLSDIGSGYGYQKAQDLEDLLQAAKHPLDTLHSFTVGVSKAMDNPVATAQSAWQGAKDFASNAVSNPYNLGGAIASATSINPRKIAAALESPAVREIVAYHGTPHRFPATEANPLGEFDASKIGTGEGAQSYGHGIYLAESPDVAKGYKQRLSNSSYIDSSSQTQKSSGDVWMQAQKAVQEAGQAHPDRAGRIASDVQDWVDSGRSAKTFLKYRQVPKGLESAYQAAMDAFGSSKKNSGSLYHADLPDEMIDRMLDWNKPLLDQTKEIKELAKTKLPPRVYDRLLTERTGDFVEAIEKYNGGKAKGAELLRQAGIPGIKYMDAGSRGQGGTGTRNFVVFPGEEKKVKILERK
jgi:hypothetical protein